LFLLLNQPFGAQKLECEDRLFFYSFKGSLRDFSYVIVGNGGKLTGKRTACDEMQITETVRILPEDVFNSVSSSRLYELPCQALEPAKMLRIKRIFVEIPCI
jgi:hypothetical protein